MNSPYIEITESMSSLSIETRLRKFRELPKLFCPMIKNLCHTACVCYREPRATHTRVFDSYCSCYSLTGVTEYD
jgi:hypothetical protein